MPRIFKKYNKNPIITCNQMPDDIQAVFNPGAIKHNGQYLLMMDAVTLSQPIVFWLARSQDEINFKIDPKPVNWPKQDPIVNIVLTIRGSQK